MQKYVRKLKLSPTFIYLYIYLYRILKCIILCLRRLARISLFPNVLKLQQKLYTTPCPVTFKYLIALTSMQNSKGKNNNLSKLQHVHAAHVFIGVKICRKTVRGLSAVKRCSMELKINWFLPRRVSGRLNAQRSCNLVTNWKNKQVFAT